MRLLQYLNDQGITIAGLARRLGVTRTTLSLIANEKRKASPQLALKIEKETQGAVTKEELRPDIFQ